MFRAHAAVRAVVTVISIIVCCGNCTAQQATQSQRAELAIKDAIRFLSTNQEVDGSWPDFAPYKLGATGLCTLALLNAGLAPDSPTIAKALDALNSRELESTYAVSLQTMAFCAANPNRYAAEIQRNAKWLATTQLENGGWSYGSKGFMQARTGDPSNSQFALLALHEAQRTGNVNFAKQEWSQIFDKSRQYWQDLQNDDGGFPYSENAPNRGSMTAAGIASLVIVGAQLDATESSVDQAVQCCGSGEQANRDRIKQAVGWLARNFSIARNPGHTRDVLYYLYALERAGRLTGQRFIGDHDWYREGVAHLLRLQDPTTGRIKPSGITGGNDFTETAFALLFLAKGKRQIVISRLQHGRSEDWNHHVGAMQNLTAHTEQAWKRDLAWQTIDINRSNLEDLLESPVLFISGTGTPSLTTEQKAMLKDYVEQGNFIFAEACNGSGCDGQAFEDYFNSLVLELFEQPLTKLPPDHPIWFAESRVLPNDLPPDTWLYGVETCCRLGVVFCPTSLSCRWELNPAYGSRPEYAPEVESELKAITKIGLNVLAYATGKELKDKLDLVTVLEDQVPRTNSERNTFFLPVLLHNAGADDAAQAPTKLVQWFGQELPIHLSSEKRLINISIDELAQYPVVYMHGRGKLRLSPDQRAALKEYLTDGFLIASAICADPDFTLSFREEMEGILGGPLTQLPEQHKMLTEEYGGFDIRRVQILDPDQSGDNIATTKRTISPRLEVGRVNQRISVIFSPLDISCALESRHSLQCKGYLREDAARIGINSILFAFLQQ